MCADRHACHSPDAVVLHLQAPASRAKGALAFLEGREGSSEALRRKLKGRDQRMPGGPA